MSVLNGPFPGWDETPDPSASLLIMATNIGGAYEDAHLARMRAEHFPGFYPERDSGRPA